MRLKEKDMNCKFTADGMIEITVPDWIVWWFVVWIGLRLLHEIFDIVVLILERRVKKLVKRMQEEKDRIASEKAEQEAKRRSENASPTVRFPQEPVDNDPHWRQLFYPDWSI